MRKILKWLGFGLAGLVALALLAVGGLYLRARAELNHTYIFQTETVAVPADQASAQHGERLALVYCGACHGREMEGGVIFQDPVLGRLTAPGIAGGLGIGGRSLEDAGLVRAIRYGVGADGKSLLVMPSEAFFYMNDQDLGDLIAYLKSVPPVETTLPATRFTPVGLALIGAGAFGELLSAEKIDPTASRPAAVEPGVTVAYGEYLTQIGECRVCHGENLTAAKTPTRPPRRLPI